MVPNKIDNQIKEKLQSRELQPSANSWDRLDAMLAVSEEKKPKKGFGWFFIAAAVAIVFGIVFFMQNDTTVTPNSNETPVVINEILIDTVKTQKNEKIIPFVQEQQPLVQTQNKNQPKIESRQQIADNGQQITDNRQQTADNRQQTADNRQQTADSRQQTTDSRQQKAYNKYVTAESLLAELEQNKKTTIPLNSKVKASSVKVNPNALLANTEKELNQTFREKAIESINKNYNALKAVVVNRNYE